MSKKNLNNYLLHGAFRDGNTLTNIPSPHNKAHLYEDYIDNILADEMCGSGTTSRKMSKLQKLDNDSLDLLYMGSQEGRRRRRRIYMTDDESDEESDTSSDEDYDPLLDVEITDDTDDDYNETCDYDSLEHELIDIGLIN